MAGNNFSTAPVPVLNAYSLYCVGGTTLIVEVMDRDGNTTGVQTVTVPDSVATTLESLYRGLGAGAAAEWDAASNGGGALIQNSGANLVTYNTSAAFPGTQVPASTTSERSWGAGSTYSIGWATAGPPAAGGSAMTTPAGTGFVHITAAAEDAAARAVNVSSADITGQLANANLANMANKTYKGRHTAGTGLPEDVNAANVVSDLGLVIGANVEAWSATLDTWATKTPPTGAVVGDSDTQTLSAKRMTPRVGTVASAAAPAINTDSVDLFRITAQAADITSMTTNLTGTPADGQQLTISITDNATPRAIAWGAKFEASGTVALPTTTSASVRLDVHFVWNTVTSAWRCAWVS